MLIYKIFRADEWLALQTQGATPGAPVDVADGYVHFSTAEQVPETLGKHFVGETDLVILAVEPDRLGESLRWERSRGGQMFPHLYRHLGLADVAWHVAVDRNGETHVVPDAVI